MIGAAYAGQVSSDVFWVSSGSTARAAVSFSMGRDMQVAFMLMSMDYD